MLTTEEFYTGVFSWRRLNWTQTGFILRAQTCWTGARWAVLPRSTGEELARHNAQIRHRDFLHRLAHKQTNSTFLLFSSKSDLINPTSVENSH